MQVQINTDNHLQGTQPFTTGLEEGLRASLGHWVDRITQIEVYLSDVNARKGGEADKHCKLEARVAGRPVLSVTDAAATFAQAVQGATSKLRHALEHDLGKVEDARHGNA